MEVKKIETDEITNQVVNNIKLVSDEYSDEHIKKVLLDVIIKHPDKDVDYLAKNVFKRLQKQKNDIRVNDTYDKFFEGILK